jgi:hypothetical protein
MDGGLKCVVTCVIGAASRQQVQHFFHCVHDACFSGFLSLLICAVLQQGEIAYVTMSPGKWVSMISSKMISFQMVMDKT